MGERASAGPVATQALGSWLMSGVKESAWASRMARRTREVIWRCAATDDQTCESTVLFRVCAGVWTPASCALCPLRRTPWARSDPAPRCCFSLLGPGILAPRVAVHAHHECRMIVSFYLRGGAETGS